MLPLLERALDNVGIIRDEAGEEITAVIRTGTQRDRAAAKPPSTTEMWNRSGRKRFLGSRSAAVGHVPKCPPPHV